MRERTPAGDNMSVAEAQIMGLTQQKASSSFLRKRTKKLLS
jgi:hypothetical protein